MRETSGHIKRISGFNWNPFKTRLHRRDILLFDNPPEFLAVWQTLEPQENVRLGLFGAGAQDDIGLALARVRSQACLGKRNCGMGLHMKPHGGVEEFYQNHSLRSVAVHMGLTKPARGIGGNQIGEQKLSLRSDQCRKSFLRFITTGIDGPRRRGDPVFREMRISRLDDGLNLVEKAPPGICPPNPIVW